MIHPSGFRRYAVTAAVAFAWPTALGLAQEPPLSVLVDASGSLRGYHETGAMDELVGSLRRAGADRTYSMAYRATASGEVMGGIAPYAGAADPNGALTLLGRGLREYLVYARPGEVIALVTDNVQDAGTLRQEEQDIGAFYQLLRDEPRFTHVSLLPLRRPFSGFLYGGGGKSSIGRYEGQRGLVVYVIGYRTVSEGAAQRVAGRIAQALGTRAIRMKPFDQAPLEATVDTAATRLLPSGGACNGSPLLPARDAPGILEPRTRVEEGQPFGGVFVLRLRSGLEGVSLDQPTLQVAITEPFRMKLANSSSPVVTANPPRLNAQLAPGGTTSATVTICFPRGLRFDTAAAVREQLATATEATGTFAGGIRVGLRLPQRDLRLTEDLRAEYSVSDPRFFTDTAASYHQRIFKLDEAFRVLAPASVTVSTQVRDYHVRFPVVLPLGPVGSKLLTWVAPILLFLLLAWALLRRRTFVLHDDHLGNFVVAPRSYGVRARRVGRDEASALIDGAPEEGDGIGGTPLSLRRLQAHLLLVQGLPAGTLRLGILGALGVRAGAGYLVDGERTRMELGAGEASFALVRAGQDAEAPGPSGERSDGVAEAWVDSWSRAGS
ncbi:MAG: hypothetical protein JWM27_2431 [Gemmatimonadetes bacterium]|nr:hypothetical protein [Gemmatimonadota bacterium]